MLQSCTYVQMSFHSLSQILPVTSDTSNREKEGEFLPQPDRGECSWVFPTVPFLWLWNFSHRKDAKTFLIISFLNWYSELFGHRVLSLSFFFFSLKDWGWDQHKTLLSRKSFSMIAKIYSFIYLWNSYNFCCIIYIHFCIFIWCIFYIWCDTDMMLILLQIKFSFCFIRSKLSILGSF